jgi:hypothetical protein
MITRRLSANHTSSRLEQRHALCMSSVLDIYLKRPFCKVLNESFNRRDGAADGTSADRRKPHGAATEVERQERGKDLLHNAAIQRYPRFWPRETAPITNSSRPSPPLPSSFPSYARAPPFLPSPFVFLIVSSPIQHGLRTIRRRRR